MNDERRELKTCKVCGHVWLPRIHTKKIYLCPNCSSRNWNNDVTPNPLIPNNKKILVVD